MKIPLDVNLSPSWVPVLQKAGFEAVHWSEAGPSEASDEQIMAYAARLSFVVMTSDLDFSAILASTKGTKPSVIQIRAQNLSPEIIKPRIITALTKARTELEAGALLTVDVDRARVRLLPLISDPTGE